jgi:DNA-binding NtrC family response regulator
MSSILVVDDERGVRALCADVLGRAGHEVEAVDTAAGALAAAARRRFDLILCDINLPDQDGVSLLPRLLVGERPPAVLLITAYPSIDTAVRGMKLGARDYLGKPFSPDELRLVVGRALAEDELRRAHGELTARLAYGSMIGDSPAMQQLRATIDKVAPSDATVLITGESGTGKELVARALHNLSPRKDAPFVAVNCAAMPAPLLESELFGHVRGAFTDAKRSRAGLFVQAGAGTIFLDEIGEMPIEMQVKLLRVLQERKVRPVGGDEEVPFEARVVTATNRDLETEVEEKRFREDLFYRINVVAIPVPPLRARAGDILLLAQYFLKRIANRTNKPVQGISGPAARLLMDYDWPGNVRELENCMERAVALCRLDEVTVDDLPAKVQEHQSSKIVITTESPGELITLDEMERRYVRQVLNAVGGNKTHAARILGIDRRSLYRRLEEPRHEQKPSGGEPPPPARAQTIPPPAAHGPGPVVGHPPPPPSSNGASNGQPGEAEH